MSDSLQCEVLSWEVKLFKGCRLKCVIGAVCPYMLHGGKVCCWEISWSASFMLIHCLHNCKVYIALKKASQMCLLKYLLQSLWDCSIPYSTNDPVAASDCFGHHYIALCQQAWWDKQVPNDDACKTVKLCVNQDCCGFAWMWHTSCDLTVMIDLRFQESKLWLTQTQLYYLGLGGKLDIISFVMQHNTLAYLTQLALWLLRLSGFGDWQWWGHSWPNLTQTTTTRDPQESLNSIEQAL